MFMGEYSHTIDAKGRIIVPVKFRESLGDNFVVTSYYSKLFDSRFIFLVIIFLKKIKITSWSF